MTKSWTDEAIVLRTYNVGETDRFCLLLTKSRGRLSARAHGVRRLTSRRSSGLLPLHRVSVTCEEHSSGMTVAAVTCLDSHEMTWADPHTFSCAERGIEILLALTVDGAAMESLYDVTKDFLAACRGPHASSLTDLFTLSLLRCLGLMPSIEHSCVSGHAIAENAEIVFSTRAGGFALRSEDRNGRALSPALVSVLRELAARPLGHTLSPSVQRELAALTQGLLGSVLPVALASPAVSLSISSLVTPI